ncbi:MAG: putative alkaline-shock protein [Firmicutes bacterium]|nr:putative alkaline-shock protein [Bacillota bacterium]MDI6705485.1 Asp23/Gls24 family envelope stress response protein [Bacillota bacterium]
MSAKIENEYGSITVSDEVLANIAGIATMECYGLVGMASKSSADGIVELLRREHLSKGVKVYSEEDNYLVIDLYIVVEFGTRISTVAQNIIDKVKYTVETMTGMKVKKVNVNVQGVRV